jgi:serine phosphatase RsbU (regulator of sigma subunit)
MLVTLQIGLIDWRHRRLTVAGAGHPPLLHVSNGTVRTFGAGSLPLGTGLDPCYREEERTLEADDCLMLCTDGILELTNARGVAMGERRLMTEAARAARSGSARQIRDAMLNGISCYKGDTEAADDMTLVVLKLGGGVGLG